MGHSSQKVSPHGFFFCIHQFFVLLTDQICLAGNHDADAAGKTGDKCHPEKGKGIAAESKIQLHVGHREGIIYPKDTVQGSDNACAVAAGSAGMKDDSKDIDNGYIDQIVCEMKHQAGNQSCCCHINDGGRKGPYGFHNRLFQVKWFSGERGMGVKHGRKSLSQCSKVYRLSAAVFSERAPFCPPAGAVGGYRASLFGQHLIKIRGGEAHIF